MEDDEQETKFQLQMVPMSPSSPLQGQAEVGEANSQTQGPHSEEPEFDTVELIQLVRKYPVLWDAGQGNKKGFQSTRSQTAGWKEIAKALNVPVSKCKRKWSQIVEAHENDEGPPEEFAHLAEYLEFLTPLSSRVELESTQTSTKPKNETEKEISLSTIMSSAIGEVQRKRELIDIVENCPWIWNKAHDDYPDRERKRETWNQIGTVLGVPAQECRKCWTNFKDIYYRKRRLSDPGKWELFDRLKFLELNFSKETCISSSCSKVEEPASAPTLDIDSRLENMINKDKLIAEVRRRPFLWILSDPSTKTQRDKGWSQISTTLNLPVPQCRQMWKNLKDIYSRVRRRRKPTWKLYELLKFLEPNYPRLERYSDSGTDSDAPEPPNFSTGLAQDHEVNMEDSHSNSKEDPLTYTSLSSHLQDQMNFGPNIKFPQCIFCLCETDYENLYLKVSSKKKDRKALLDLKNSSTQALCDLFGLDEAERAQVQNGTFCGPCFEEMLSIEFMSKCLKEIEKKLGVSKNRIERRLGINATKLKSQEEILEEKPSSLPLVEIEVPVQVKIESPTAPLAPTPKPQSVIKYSRSGRAINHPKKFEFNQSEIITPDEFEVVDENSKLSHSESEPEFDLEPQYKKPKFQLTTPKPRKAKKKNSGQKRKPASRHDEYKCTVNQCPSVFRTQTQLKAHIFRIHENDPYPFHCEESPECEAKFGTLSTLRVHILRDHKNEGGKFTCKFCNKQFYKRGDMKTHVRSVHNEYNLRAKCSICTKSWTEMDKEEDIQAHETLHQNSNNNPCLCVICNASHFQSAWELQRHVQSEHEEGMHRCSFCESVFISKAKLEKHVKIRHSQLRELRSHSCTFPLCNFKALSESGLKHHLIKHGDKGFKCDYPNCDKAYKWGSALRIHQRKSHTKDYQFSCSFCPKKFVIRSEAMNHEIYHSHIRPFMCEICPISFKSKRNLENHKKVVHEKIGKVQTVEKVKKGRKRKNPKSKIESEETQETGPVPVVVNLQISSDEKLHHSSYEEQLQEYSTGIQYQLTDVSGTHTTTHHAIISTTNGVGDESGNIVLTLPAGTTELYPGPDGTSYSLILAPYGEIVGEEEIIDETQGVNSETLISQEDQEVD